MSNSSNAIFFLKGTLTLLFSACYKILMQINQFNAYQPKSTDHDKTTSCVIVSKNNHTEHKNVSLSYKSAQLSH